MATQVRGKKDEIFRETNEISSVPAMELPSEKEILGFFLIKRLQISGFFFPTSLIREKTKQDLLHNTPIDLGSTKP